MIVCRFVKRILGSKGGPKWHTQLLLHLWSHRFAHRCSSGNPETDVAASVYVRTYTCPFHPMQGASGFKI